VGQLHFSDFLEQQQLTQLIVGKSEQEARTILRTQPGVGNVDIKVQGSNGTPLPSSPSEISILIQ
jgi:hypothetical protein